MQGYSWAMAELPTDLLRRKVRRLTLVCMLLWSAATLAPVLLARTDMSLGHWPLDFWLAAQGSVLMYLLIVSVYAWLVNRWERQAGQCAFETPGTQDV